MSDKKISELAAAGTLTGAEIFALVQDGVSKKATLEDIANALGVNYFITDEELILNSKIITSVDLDEDGNYTLTKEDLDSVLSFYIDADLYPDFKIITPTEFIDYVPDYEKHLPKIMFYIVDAGVWQINNNSPFVKQVSRRDTAGDANSSGEPEKTVFMVVPGEGGIELVPVNHSLFKTRDIEDNEFMYTNSYLAFTNNLQGKVNDILVADNTGYYLDNGLNIIRSAAEGDQPAVVGLGLNFLDSRFPNGVEIKVQFLCDASVEWGGNVSNLSPSSLNPNAGDILTFKRVETGLSVYEYVQIDRKDEVILNLGTITYEDINTASASDVIQLPLSSIPANYFIERLYFQIVEVADVALDVLKIKFIDLGFSGIDYSTSPVSKNIELLTPNTSQLVGSTNNVLEIGFDVGGGEINPRNLEAGVFKIKALIKQYPI